MQKRIIFLSSVILLFAITFFFPVGNQTSYAVNGKSDFLQHKIGIDVKKITAKSGNHYSYFLKGKSKIAFTTVRPDRNDSSILLCIPAAFTRTGDLKPDGFYMVNGVAGNTDSINHSIGGAIKIKGDTTVRFFSTAKGKIFTKEFIDSLSREKVSVFQQIYMIRNFTAENSNSTKTFQCRGVAILATGEICVVESDEDITLKVFAGDLAGKNGVKELLYTDMGAWDEGWYRNNKGKVITIGKNRSETKKQSNWIVFRK